MNFKSKYNFRYSNSVAIHWMRGPAAQRRISCSRLHRVNSRWVADLRKKIPIGDAATASAHDACASIYVFINCWTSHWAQFLFIFGLLNNRCTRFHFARRSTMYKTHFHLKINGRVRTAFENYHVNNGREWDENTILNSGSRMEPNIQTRNGEVSGNFFGSPFVWIQFHLYAFGSYVHFAW